jgi:predicted HicB family RNase H-like nuclease
VMQYKGYIGTTAVDEEAGVIRGRIIGLRDVITFESDTVAGSRKAFEESVDDYLDFCKERGEEPERPFSGRLLLRIDPELHRRMTSVAQVSGVSLNSLIEDVLSEVFSLATGKGGIGFPGPSTLMYRLATQGASVPFQEVIKPETPKRGQSSPTVRNPTARARRPKTAKVPTEGESSLK